MRELTWNLLLFLAALLLLGWATSAHAHHILGLPHYAYKDNYPQVPVLEYPARTGPWDILLTSYPGRPVPGEAARLTVYIKNGATGDMYPDSVSMRVLERGNFGRNDEVLAPTEVVAFGQLYEVTATMPEEGDYTVELSMMVEGQLEVIPFLVVAGDPGSPWIPISALVVGLLLFVITIRAIKIKRDRREAT